jgi:hypothetical protein
MGFVSSESESHGQERILSDALPDKPFRSFSPSDLEFPFDLSCTSTNRSHAFPAPDDWLALEDLDLLFAFPTRIILSVPLEDFLEFANETFDNSLTISSSTRSHLLKLTYGSTISPSS